MGWIDVKDKMPPEGLEVLLEVSGRFDAPYGLVAVHGFYIGSWIVPKGEEEGHWLITDGSEENYHFINPEVHAWMPLPEHYQVDDEEDRMEHAMFEDDPDWLYKGDYVYTPRKYKRMIGCADALALLTWMLPAFDKRDEVIERVRYEFEKDVPVKPKFNKGVYGKKYDSYSCGNCGNCGKQVYDKFCSNCGFAIDWRNLNDHTTVEHKGIEADETGSKTAERKAETEHRKVQENGRADIVAEDDLTAVVRSGSQYQGGKIRIYALYQHENNAKKRAEFLKQEYGIGGRSIALQDGERGFVDFDGKGVKVSSFESDYKKTYTWAETERAIKKLIDARVYLTEEENAKWEALENTPCPKPAYKYPPEDNDDEETSDTGVDKETGDSGDEDYVQRSLFDGD